ncbi:caspase b-like [Osmerus eperlanus]|uniref:caspase b-like n=1 Tax=Osmerus eperlanus TaxID=29151 RepID=UPI002E107594
MATSGEEYILESLDQLGEKGLKRFKWFLQKELLDGFYPIPKNNLENADEEDTVDKMVETYTVDGAVEITVEILRRMKRNDLAQTLMSEEETDEDSSSSESTGELNDGIE